jgi:hypothetical protein
MRVLYSFCTLCADKYVLGKAPLEQDIFKLTTFIFAPCISMIQLLSHTNI